MLKIENLRKAYGKYHALNGLNMEIPEHALYGFVGPNGAGKTTTIKILSGLLTPDSGTVMIRGMDALNNPKRMKSEIGYVPDVFGVYDNLKVSEYMEFFASCYGMEGLKARRRSYHLLEQVGLEEKMNFYVEGLSQGMKQRLCLARALIHDPSILIMDEPTSGLDPRTRFEYKEVLMELINQGKTIFISSHILSELSELCTNVGIIDQGKLVLSGSIADILSKIETSNPIFISVIGDTKKAVAILKNHPDVQTITVQMGEIQVEFTGDKQAEVLLLQQLVDAEVLVRGFVRENGSLESVFMQITNQKKDKEVFAYED